MARAPKPDASTAGTEATASEGAEVSKGQGRAVILPDGSRRVDYIKRRYYEEGADRSTIAKELTALQEKPVPYQIVFAATKAKRTEEQEAKVPKAAPAEEATK